MPPSTDETRRAFLLKLARTAAFVPPAVLTVSVGELRAVGGPGGGGPGGGGGGGGGPGGGQPNATTGPVTGLSPTSAQTIQSIELQSTQQSVQEPWSSPAQEAPWSRPPPTQTGR